MIELRTLGEVDLRIDGESPRSIVEHPRRLALFSYLVAADVAVHRRGSLVAMFWPEHTPVRARASLRKALHYIRANVGDDMFINRGDEEILIDRSGVRCDASALRMAVDDGEHTLALKLYRGEFMAGFHIDEAGDFEAWQERERRYFSGAAVKSALQVAREYTGDDAAEAANAAVELAPLSENVVRNAVEVMMLAGYQARAIRVLTEYGQRLERDLGDHEGARRCYSEAIDLWGALQDTADTERNALLQKLA